MEDTNRIYANGGDEIVFADGEAVPLSNISFRVKKVTVQAWSQNVDSAFCGAGNPNIELVNNADQPFTNCDLDSIFVRGTAGDKVTFFYEY